MEGHDNSSPRQSQPVFFDSKNIYKTKAGRQYSDAPSHNQRPSRFKSWFSARLAALQRHDKQTIIIVTIIATLLVGGIIALILFLVLGGASSSGESTSISSNVDQSALAVENAYESGGYDSMMAEYERLIAGAETDIERANYYSMRADSVFNLYNENENADPDNGEFIDDELANKYREQLLADALKADELLQSVESAEMLSYYYDYLGDTDASAHYRQVSADRDAELNDDTGA